MIQKFILTITNIRPRIFWTLNTFCLSCLVSYKNKTKQFLSNSSLSLYSLSLVFRLGVDFVLPLSQEEQEEEEQEEEEQEEEEPPTKIYQKEVYYGLEIWHLDLKI